MQPERIVRAMTFGSFDLFHYGHHRLLTRIKAIAGHLSVALASDDVIRASGRKEPFYSFPQRREMLEAQRSVDAVIQHDGPVDGAGRVKVIQQKITFVQHYKIDLVVMGDDWAGEYDFLLPWCEVLYLPRTPGISTSQLKRGLLVQEPLGSDSGNG